MSLLSQLKKKRKGFVMMPVILATLIVGLLGVGLTSVYSGAFAVMSTAKTGNEAGNIAGLEKEVLKTLGIDEYSTELTNGAWENAKRITGGDSDSDWEYKVEDVNEIKKDDDVIKIVKVSVRKKGEDSIRYSEEVPLSSQSNGGEAIGTIVPRLNANFKSESEKKKYLLCDGSSFSAVEYPKLAALIGTTLPDLRGRFLQGNDVGFSYIEAGLPNITGHFYQQKAFLNGSSTNGCFTEIIYDGSVVANASFSNTSSAILFNAYNSSTVYGNSNTVQPPALTVRYYIRAK